MLLLERPVLPNNVDAYLPSNVADMEALIPVALSVGITTIDYIAEMPLLRRGHDSEVTRLCEQLALSGTAFDGERTAVFIGQGCCPGRPAVSKWASRFHVGPDGSSVQCLELYRQHVLQTPDLLGSLCELVSCTLVCDCSPPSRCHGEILVILVLSHCLGQLHRAAATTPPWKQMSPKVMWSQMCIANAVCSHFPQMWVRREFPALEDLL